MPLTVRNAPGAEQRFAEAGKRPKWLSIDNR
jgi:hypothetical protein